MEIVQNIIKKAGWEHFEEMGRELAYLGVVTLVATALTPRILESGHGWKADLTFGLTQATLFVLISSNKKGREIARERKSQILQTAGRIFAFSLLVILPPFFAGELTSRLITPLSSAASAAKTLYYGLWGAAFTCALGYLEMEKRKGES